jgi:hypothetical protein
MIKSKKKMKTNNWVNPSEPEKPATWVMRSDNPIERKLK